MGVIQDEDTTFLSSEFEKDVDGLNGDDESDDNRSEEEEDNDDGIPGGRSVRMDTIQDALAQHKSELNRLRQVRAKQRVELDQQAKEHENLKTQRKSRLERRKLQDQVQELQDIIQAKVLLKEMAQNELEQTRAYHRRLHQTLTLLQEGVGYILEQSAITDDPSTTDPVGRIRATKREALVKEILKDNWNQSTLFDADEEVEVEDLKSGTNDTPLTKMVPRRELPRYASINSMISEIASSIDPGDMQLPESHSRKRTVQRAVHDLTSSIHRQQHQQQKQQQQRPARSQSRTYSQKDEQEQRPRSRSLSTHMKKSEHSFSSKISSKRRVSMGSSKQESLGRSRSVSSSDMSGTFVVRGGLLQTMLQSFPGHDEGVDFDGGGSHDTPRTTNSTPGGGGR
jgi:hypothetical protein